jgi:transcriptional regulator with PAS, ATPase and Fis domain
VIETKKFEVTIEPGRVPKLKEVVDLYIRAVLEVTGYNKARAAAALGIGRTTMYRKLGLRED